MTDASRRSNAERALILADDCLAEARLLRDGGRGRGAASRAYYAAFHAARALLYSLGFETKSHSGVTSLLGEHFIRPGRLAPEFGRVLSHRMADRHDADSLLEAVFDQAEADAAIDEAARFVAEARRLLGDD